MILVLLTSIAMPLVPKKKTVGLSSSSRPVKKEEKGGLGLSLNMSVKGTSPIPKKAVSSTTSKSTTTAAKKKTTTTSSSKTKTTTGTTGTKTKRTTGTLKVSHAH